MIAIKILRETLALPSHLLNIIEAILGMLIDLLDSVALWWNAQVDKLFRPVCRHVGHDMDEPSFGWRFCKRCDHGEKLAVRIGTEGQP